MTQTSSLLTFENYWKGLAFLPHFFLSFLIVETHELADGEEETGSPLSREPDAGLDPRTLGIMT